MSLVLYLHGFASSSQSHKALQTRAYFQQHHPEIELLVPDLPYTPLEALAEVSQVLAGRVPTAVIGSSLGGFLATWLAEQHDCRACLINPAVAPYRLLRHHLGRYYHPVRQCHYEVSEQAIELLQQLEPPELAKPSNYLVLLQSGDEVLDYRQAVHFYQHCQLDVQQGGDHSYQNYLQQLPAIVRFCLQTDEFCTEQVMFQP
ncbi:YqiA/YcfP family alpha/beta fold hydrolase [Alkalimonas sp. NCh-2]|uniref:YqiA/YcfP family alpha/beta fold hydrolase n=1 Tax=Alkalimonas sp. NCh-2 TaxID=3144846 RepID=UPI0031F719BE